MSTGHARRPWQVRLGGECVLATAGLPRPACERGRSRVEGDRYRVNGSVRLSSSRSRSALDSNPAGPAKIASEVLGAPPFTVVRRTQQRDRTAVGRPGDRLAGGVGDPAHQLVDEDYARRGLSGEIAALIAEHGVGAQSIRVTCEQTIPYARPLERNSLPSVVRISAAAHRLLEPSQVGANG